ncbi:hypothetical protein EDD22DRAFT_958543 [Suillus occidentalis]|nr:hypothetical protein EDD22DRAFT_958543 [Suillus occidentalis]
MSSRSKGWLPSSSNTTSISSPNHKQQVQKPTEPVITLPTDKQLLDKQVLEDLKAAIQARLDLTNDDQPGLSLEHCAVILEALQYPQSNTIICCFLIVMEQCLISFNLKIIIGITPAEFAYFEDTEELQIMPPLPVHEQPAAHLSKAINKFTDTHLYNKLLIDITIHLNHCIQNKDMTNITDLHLAIIIQLPEDNSADEIKISKPASKWVGECGLSLDYEFMVWKLSGTCDGHCNIDLVLIMAFEEWARWQQPKETSITAQTFHTIPPLDYKEFIPTCIKKDLKFGLVNIHSHVWIDISEVRYSIFRRGTDGHFDFNSKNPDMLAEGTLYPTIQMSNVERMLKDGANAEDNQLSHKSKEIGEKIGGGNVTVTVWRAAVNQISSSIYLTAYCRYLDWRHHKYSKRKISHDIAQTSSTGDQTTTSISELSDPTLVLSVPSTSSSSPTLSSSGLLPDVPPEPLAKKAKTQTLEKPKVKSKSKPKQKGKVKSGP